MRGFPFTDEMSKNEGGRVEGGERAFESFAILKWPPEVRVEKNGRQNANRNDRLSHFD